MELEKTQEIITGSRVIDGPKGGKIRTGGNPGNKGNVNATGRPKEDIRRQCRESFAERIARIEMIADSAANLKNQLAAIDLLGKYGGLTQTDVTSGDQPSKVIILPSDVQGE